MKGFLRGVAGAFVQLDEETPAPVQQAQQPVANSQPIASQRATAPAYQPINTGFDQDMVDALTAVSIKRPTAFTAFVEASKKLEAVPGLTEDMRLQAAFVTAKGEGRTVEQMLGAVDVHVMDVNAEVDKFNRISDGNIKTEVEAVNAKAQSLLNENDEIARKIAGFQNEITNLTNRSQENSVAAATLSQQAVDSANQITHVKEQFTKAAEHVKQNLLDRKAMLSALVK